MMSTNSKIGLRNREKQTFLKGHTVNVAGQSISIPRDAASPNHVDLLSKYFSLKFKIFFSFSI